LRGQSLMKNGRTAASVAGFLEMTREESDAGADPR
jgi:hypothetical protein